jgi:hypothetical protein
MYAVVVRVSIKDVDAATKELTENVVPRASGAPGFKAGYWTRKDDNGLSMLIFESEEQAKAAAEMVQQNVPDTVTLDHVGVREVVASA